jgi:hydrogenase assembly chaperone HypC/HupF
MSECVVAHRCITCGDVALPMRVLAHDDELALARCASVQGHREDVETSLVAPVAPGEWLLVHAGTAIGRAQEAAGDTQASDPVAGGRERRISITGRAP